MKKVSGDNLETLCFLVSQAGSQRKAVGLIESVRGVAPSKSAMDRAVKGGGTEYSVQCMIDDLKLALSK